MSLKRTATGKVIRERLWDADITMVELAKRAELSRGVIYDWMNDERASLDTIRRVARVFGLRPSQILLLIEAEAGYGRD